MKTFCIEEFKHCLEEAGLLLEVRGALKENQKVSILTYHSKEVAENTLFICKGATFKKAYLEEAIERGGVAYVAEEDYQIPQIPCFLVSDIRKAMPLLASLFYQQPSAEMKLIGVGGTKGKTTTTFYIKSILDVFCRKHQKTLCGVLSSIYNFDGVQKEVAKNTTPEALELFSYLNRGRNQGMEFLAMEVSSQALKYHRVDTLNYDIGIFLNISEDHISPIEHEDFADYFSSKLKLFPQTRTAILNRDSDYFKEIMGAAKASKKRITFSASGKKADYRVSRIEKTEEGSRFEVEGPDYRDEISLNMHGFFNVENALAAIVATRELGVDTDSIREGLLRAKVKGRMEIFRNKERDLVAIVDYAHNRLSFETLFSSMKKEFPGYKLVAIFGSVGGKAFGRRRELGEVAGKYADYCVLTADEPNFEHPKEIAKEIGGYLEKEGCPFVIIEDRKEAISKTLKEAKEKTLVIVAGKGHEGSMKVNGISIDYPSDLEIVEEYVR